MSASKEAKTPILQSFRSLKADEAQLELTDSLAERIQLLGGVALATAHDLVQETRLTREGAEHGDDGMNDIIVSELIRTNELRAWSGGEHLVGSGGEL